MTDLAGSLERGASLREQVTESLRAMIVTGALEPGRVYSAPALAGEFGVSATPVREAMLDLAGEGAAGVYDIRAGIHGFPAEGQLLLSSVPALTSEQIVLLLNTGVSPVPREQDASATPEGKLTAEPSWLELGSIRGLFGWNTGEAATGEPGEGAFSDGGAVGYEWSWR